MREAGKVTAYILSELKNVIKPGISTLEIDRFVEKTVKAHKMIAAEKGYCGYPANVCVSVNEEVVHGIPSKKRIFPVFLIKFASFEEKRIDCRKQNTTNRSQHCPCDTT